MTGPEVRSSPGRVRGEDEPASFDYVMFRELGRQNRIDGVSEPPPGDPLPRVAWAAGWNDDAALREAVDAALASGATEAEVAEAIGSATERTVRADYEEG
jgi:hypothetical protein